MKSSTKALFIAAPLLAAVTAVGIHNANTGTTLLDKSPAIQRLTSNIETTVSPMDDSKSHKLLIRATDGESNALIGGKRALFVHCSPELKRVDIVTGDHMGLMVPDAPMQIRYDKGEVINETWSNTVGIQGGIASRDFDATLLNVANSSEVSFGWRPYGKKVNNHATFKFSRSNVADLKKMQQLCASV